MNGATYKTGQTDPAVNSAANGYRLPTEAEWEWAARGGNASQGYTYSGSNDVNAVAWIKQNSSDGAKAVGTKEPNEIGLYDMSGNALEWCEDKVYGSTRRFRGGSWDNMAYAAAVDIRGDGAGAYSRPPHYGFRIARSLGQ